MLVLLRTWITVVALAILSVPPTRAQDHARLAQIQESCGRFTDERRTLQCFNAVLAIQGQQHSTLRFLHHMCAEGGSECYRRGIANLKPHYIARKARLEKEDLFSLIQNACPSLPAKGAAGCYSRGLDWTGSGAAKVISSGCGALDSTECFERGLNFLANNPEPRPPAKQTTFTRYDAGLAVAICSSSKPSPEERARCLGAALSGTKLDAVETVLKACPTGRAEFHATCLEAGARFLSKHPASQDRSSREGQVYVLGLLNTVCTVSTDYESRNLCFKNGLLHYSHDEDLILGSCRDFDKEPKEIKDWDLLRELKDSKEWGEDCKHVYADHKPGDVIDCKNVDAKRTNSHDDKNDIAEDGRCLQCVRCETQAKALRERKLRENNEAAKPASLCFQRGIEFALEETTAPSSCEEEDVRAARLIQKLCIEYTEDCAFKAMKVSDRPTFKEILRGCQTNSDKHVCVESALSVLITDTRLMTACGREEKVTDARGPGSKAPAKHDARPRKVKKAKVAR